MKKVTFTYSMYVRDEVSDQDAINALTEVMAQDDDWNDCQFKIESNCTEEDHSPDEIGLMTNKE